MPNPRVLVAVVGTLLVASSIVPARVAADELDPMCVPRPAQQVLTQCPAGQKLRRGTPTRKAVFRAAPPPRERAPEREWQRPGDPDGDFGDQFRGRGIRGKVELRLLVGTLQRLEALLAKTEASSPDHVLLLRRTAEEYVSLRKLAADARLVAEEQARSAKKRGDAARKAQAARTASDMKRLEERARKGAIKYYSRIRSEHPTYAKLDEVLYYLAFELEQGQEHERARKVYYELIQKAPQSKYVPHAYLAFGELFFAEAQADPTQWDLAAKAYAEVVRYPAPGNKVHGYARYKLAYVRWNQEDYPQAISEMKRVIDYGTQYPSVPGAAALVAAARRDLVPLYAASGDPARAYAFFQPLSGDGPGDSKRTLRMLNELAVTYLDTGHYVEAIATFEDLERRDAGDASCGYRTHITEAMQALYSGDKRRLVQALDRQLAVQAAFVAAQHGAAAKASCRNDSVALVVETAMAWHLEAVGSGSIRGTGDRETMRLAATLYEKVLDAVTAAEFATLKFPRIVKEDWPTRYKLIYAGADLCYFSQDWECAARGFTRAVEEDPDAPDVAEASYAAALAFQKLYAKSHSESVERSGNGDVAASTWARLAPQPLTKAQQDMIGAFDRYLCVVEPGNDAEIAEQYSEIEYARARLYYEAHHWEEAAAAFRKIALERPEHESAIYAAQLSLEALNVLRTHAEPRRESCVADIGEDVATYAKTFCQEPGDAERRDQCAVFTRVSCDVDRLRAEQLVKQADGAKPADARELYRQAGDLYLALWRKHGEQQLERNEPAACEKMDEVLYNLAKSYQAAHLLAQAIQARRILVNPAYGLHQSALAQQTLYDLGQNHQAIAMYDGAADYFERYANATRHSGEHAAAALSDAVILRLGLGQDEAALADAKRYATHFGSRQPARAARIAFAIAAHHGERGDWRAVEQQLRRAMGAIDTAAELDVRVQAHALLGRAALELGRRDQAAREYATVLRAWKDPVAAKQAIDAGEGTPAERERRLGRALAAVGEATYFSAEEKRLAVERVRFPAYHGPGSMAAVRQHIDTKVAGWIAQKRPLLEDATRAYGEVLTIAPQAPPEWVIASGSRVGALWSQFVTEFRAAPIPEAIRQDTELRNAYYAALDAASEPYKELARKAFETCLDYSVGYQHFDAHSRSCEEWLATNYKARYHLLDELREAPTRANSVAREHPPALRIGGEPLRAER